MALETERNTYSAKVAEWSDREGQFVLIHGDTVVDFYGTYDDAIKAGYEHFGLADPFLVKQVHSVEHALFISRFAEPAA